MLGYNLAVPPYVRQALFSRVLDNDDLLRTIRTLVLVVHGAEDAIVKPCVVEHHMAKLAHAQVHLLQGAGHAPFWDAAEAFNQQLRAYCEGL